MSNGGWLLFLIIVLALIALLAWPLSCQLAYKDGWNNGREHERNRINEQRIRANQTGPRPPAASPAGGRPPWYTVVTASRVTYGGVGGPSTIPIPHRHAPARPAILTSTGEFRALAVAGTDLYIDEMRADEERFRATLIQPAIR